MAGSAPGLLQSYRDYVRDVATRYKDEPTVAMWQLMNEAEAGIDLGVAGCSPTASISLRGFADDMGTLVKAIDSNHLLSFGTIGNGQCGATGDDYKTLHSLSSLDLCEYHDYGNPAVAVPGDQWNGLGVRLNQCNSLEKPLFIGEAGINTNEVGGNLQTRANLFEAKFAAQFGSGIVGILVWDWSNEPSADGYEIKVGDPTLSVLSKYGRASVRSDADFDGDGKSDVSVFRPANGAWYLQQSTNGFTGLQFGTATDKLVPADYDGDGKTDVAVFRGGTWYLMRSSAGFTGFAFGAPDDIPQPSDFDGDGKAELAVWRPSNGTWYIYNLATNQFTAAQFGASTDKPVVGDYNGDNKADYAVYRPSNGTWYIAKQIGTPSQNFDSVKFGIAEDKPVQADYDGDGKTDVAVFRPSNGSWYLLRSTAGFTGVQFGISTDLPTPADYDGDGKADISVFRSGNWYRLNSSNGAFYAGQFGAATDRPIQNAFMQ